jgi:hypothetical protein
MNEPTPEPINHPCCANDLHQIPRCHHEYNSETEQNPRARSFDMEGRVRAISGPNTPDDINVPEFAFEIRLRTNPGATKIFYFPMSLPGSGAMIAAITAAFATNAYLLVWAQAGDPDRAARVQIRARPGT